jgi:hypothetical protein
MWTTDTMRLPALAGLYGSLPTLDSLPRIRLPRAVGRAAIPPLESPECPAWCRDCNDVGDGTGHDLWHRGLEHTVFLGRGTFSTDGEGDRSEDTDRCVVNAEAYSHADPRDRDPDAAPIVCMTLNSAVYDLHPVVARRLAVHLTTCADEADPPTRPRWWRRLAHWAVGARRNALQVAEAKGFIKGIEHGTAGGAR